MTITEKMLLDGYDGLSIAGVLISQVGGSTIYWNYRIGRDTDGANPMTEERRRAGEISLEYNRFGAIRLMPECENHPALETIANDYAALWGDQI